MPDTEHVRPDEPNRLKGRKSAAESRARQAVATLAARGGNPLAGILADLDAGAWTCEPPSRDRTAFAETLEGAGAAVSSAFGAQGDSFQGEASAEPAEVDPDDPGDGWKATEAGIDARTSGWFGRSAARSPFLSTGAR